LHRKVVTVLFCDVVNSTALAESRDAEAVQGLLARYFERMKEIAEFHGGTVEKFIGDAVMAVFGVPIAHEDDAIRACRAALAMRDAFQELGLDGRIGLDTGEVVTGSAERLATGDAINVAKRLESSAQPGEVLIGSETLGLVGPAFCVAEAQLLELKGKTEPVAAHRLVSLRDEPEPSRVFPFVGRVPEMEQLMAAWAGTLAGPRCQLITVVGEAGVGKSRLIAEAAARTGARVVRGHCAPYGEGTYGPLIEVVKQLDQLPNDAAAAAAIRSLLGEANSLAGADEIAWAFRKLLEEQAPLVVCLDDLQWAEETFLDLVEATAILATNAAVLLVCSARPELLELRPGWEVTLRLRPLPHKDASELVGDAVPKPLRELLMRRASGNPFFLTEMVVLAEGGSDVGVPPTLRALLAARLDQLQQYERSVLERGAVEGELFHRGAVAAMATEETPMVATLATLVRRDLLLPDRPTVEGEDAYRFRHVLFRDAVYDALAKENRAELHCRLARWLDECGEKLVEADELIGYHLERATQCLAEIDQPDPELAFAAGDRLAAAGRRALWRADNRTAEGLLYRSLDLTRPYRLDLHAELDLAWSKANPLEGAAIADDAAERASSDSVAEAAFLARVVATQRRIEGAGGSLDELEQLAHQALPLVEAAGDHRGLVQVWNALVVAANTRGRYEDQANAALKALEHSRQAGERVRHLFGLGGALVHGPTPAGQALNTIDALLPEDATAPAILNRALLLAMLDRFSEAWEIAIAAAERLKELGENTWHVRLAEIAWLEGDFERAYDYYKSQCDALSKRGQHANLSTFISAQARCLCSLQRYSAAEPLSESGRELASLEDVEAQVMWRRARGIVDAHRSEHLRAEGLLTEAVGLAAGTDSTQIQAEAYEDLGLALERSGRREEARRAWQEALDRYDRKEIVPLARRLRERLA
jgi:class 3 adenylate cyclase/tetratricopeptide (TPR) repeat protein